MSIIGPDILGTFADYRWRYWETDRFSLPENILQGGFDPVRPGVQPGPRTTQSASNTPADPPAAPFSNHPFASAFTNEYDEVDLA